MASNFLDKNGVLYLWQKITNKFVAKETGKGLSTNDYTTTEKDKLGALPAIKSIGAGLELNPETGALTATGGGTADSVAWGKVINKPTTLEGYGITDAAKSDHNHDTTYLKLSGGQMTGPIQFSADQGQIEKTSETAETKVKMTATGTEILFDDKTAQLRNRVTVSNAGVEILGGATLADGSETPDTGVKITINKESGVKIPMLVDPVDNRDAVHKKYVDDALALKANSADVYAKTETYSKTELDGKLSSVYRPGGSSDFASLPTPDAVHSGLVYSMTEAFTTDERFIEGAGKQYPIGTNVAVVTVMVEDAPEYKFDVLAGFVDLSAYMKTTDMVAITNEEIDTIVGDAT